VKHSIPWPLSASGKLGTSFSTSMSAYGWHDADIDSALRVPVRRWALRCPSQASRTTSFVEHVQQYCDPLDSAAARDSLLEELDNAMQTMLWIMLGSAAGHQGDRVQLHKCQYHIILAYLTGTGSVQFPIRCHLIDESYDTTCI
jgi:hypothetical protein